MNEKTIMDNQNRQKPLDPAEIVADTLGKRPWSKPTITTEGNVFELTLGGPSSSTEEEDMSYFLLS